MLNERKKRETGKSENYTRNEWRRCDNYTRNEWRRCDNYTLGTSGEDVKQLHSKRVEKIKNYTGLTQDYNLTKPFLQLELKYKQKHTPNEWKTSKVHSNRVGNK